MVFISRKKLPQAFNHPEKVFFSKQWFLFWKGGQVYFPDWLCWLIASILLACIVGTVYQQLPIRDMSKPEMTIQPYNPIER